MDRVFCQKNEKKKIIKECVRNKIRVVQTDGPFFRFKVVINI